jgi:rhodanese-related sulfurtransferase
MRHRGDSRSERAAALLRESGFEARALDGGVPAWEAAGLPVELGRGAEHAAGSGA